MDLSTETGEGDRFKQLEFVPRKFLHEEVVVREGNVRMGQMKGRVSSWAIVVPSSEGTVNNVMGIEQEGQAWT